MARPTDGNPEESTTPDERGDPTEFETAQEELFEAVGLDVRSRFIDIESIGGRTQVLDAGPPDDRPRLLFVHGTASFGAFFAPLMAHLDGVRMVTFDRPGYGLADPFVYTEGNLLQTCVEALAGVLDELAVDQIDLVGHSMGGHASIAFALARPERVRRLLLLGAVPAFPGTRPPLPLRLLTVPLLNRVLRRTQKRGEEGVLDIAAIFGERDAIQDYPAFIRAIAAHEDDPKSARAGFTEFNALFSIRGWHSTIRIRDAELRTLQHPTTVVWGDHDPLGSPDDVRDGVASIPDARLETIDVGHIPFLARPERCAHLVRAMLDSDPTAVD